MSSVTLEQIGELIAQANAGRITWENLQAFLQSPENYSASQADVFSVTVDRGKSIEEMVLAGHYDWSNENINSANFSIDGLGVETVEMKPVHLNKVVSSNEVLAHLETLGLRPAKIEELLAFGVSHPEIQREYPVVCLGSSWVGPVGRRLVPCLSWRGSYR